MMALGSVGFRGHFWGDFYGVFGHFHKIFPSVHGKHLILQVENLNRGKNGVNRTGFGLRRNLLEPPRRLWVPCDFGAILGAIFMGFLATLLNILTP